MKRKKNVEDFTAEDMNAIFEDDMDSSWTKFDYLCAVTSVFSEVEKSMEEEDKKNKNQSSVIDSEGEGGVLERERERSSSPPRKKPLFFRTPIPKKQTSLSFRIPIPKKQRSVLSIREKEESSSSSSINSSKRQRLMRDVKTSPPLFPSISEQERSVLVIREKGESSSINSSKTSPLKKTQVSNPPLFPPFPAISEQEFSLGNLITAGNPILNLTAKEERLKKEKILKRPVEESPNYKKSSKRVSPKRSEKEEVGDEAAKKKGIVSGPNPPPELPTEFKNRIGDMGGTDLKLVIQKELFRADIDVGQNRLLMPQTQIMSDDFLSDEEKNVLKMRDGKNGKNCKGITAGLIDFSPNEFQIVLKKWNMGTCKPYVFNKSWCFVVQNNGLEEHMIVQIWSFRVHGRLYFALVKLPEQEEEQ